MTNLHEEWDIFIKKFTSELVTPLVSMHDGKWLTNTPLCEFEKYNLGTELLDLVNTMGPIVFVDGLPLMPHDMGYQFWSVTVSRESFVFSVSSDHKVRKKSRKARLFDDFVQKSPTFAWFKTFKLPMKVYFDE